MADIFNLLKQKNTVPEYGFSVSFVSDYGSFVLDETNAEKNEDGLYEFKTEFGKILATSDEKDGYSQFFLSVVCEKDLTLYDIEAEFEFAKQPKEAFRYDTFRDASAFALLRFESESVIVGFANPVFRLKTDGCKVKVGFCPSLKLAAGERFDCDPFFAGVTARCGEIIEPETPVTAFRVNGNYHTRYHNPSGKILLDREEMRSFAGYLNNYLSPYCKQLKVVFYTYFSPFPQLIETDEDEKLYYRYIDNFKKLGGDLIIFNPIQRFILPAPTKDGRWIIAPEGSRAARILSYCRDKNIGYGFTWGSAVLNTNSPMTSYTLPGERNHWKKIGKAGELSRENCIACNDFYEWFKQAQLNTIREDKITLWDWDPGPGNASFCYSASHGHIPGEGYYKGYRDAMRMIADMKEACPELVIQSFHGLKEYGVWGMKGIDWHESYWEQDPYFFAAAYPDFSADRYTASGMRMQCWWNRNFRFLPAGLNQFMATRMIQNCGWPHFLSKLFDFYGYRYALMSALATGGCVTIPMLPENINLDGYAAFLKKWTKWGRDHYDYNENVICFGNQVKAGGVDGYAKWKGDKGFIFLCNPAPMDVAFEFELNDKIGFAGNGSYSFKQLYPDNGSMLFDFVDGKCQFRSGDRVHLTVPGYQVVLLELCKSNQESLFNLAGKVKFSGGDCIIETVAESGKERSIAVKTDENIRRLLVNNVEIPFERNGDFLTASVMFGEYEPRQIDGFACDNQSVVAPFIAAAGKTYTSECLIGNNVKELLKKGADMMTEPMRDAVKQAITLGNDSYLWSQPDRLFLTVTYRDARDAGQVKLLINGKECPLLTQKAPAHGLSEDFIVGYYADVTDIVCFGEINKFSLVTTGSAECFGIQLYYPYGSDTETVHACGRSAAVKAMPVKVQSKQPVNHRQARVNKGWITEGYVEEYSEFTLCADVNLPFDEIDEVFCSNPINIDDSKMTLMTDNRLHYDAPRGVWKKTFYMGTRQFLIIDEEFLSVWVVAKDGRVSDRYRVRIDWKLH